MVRCPLRKDFGQDLKKWSEQGGQFLATPGPLLVRNENVNLQLPVGQHKDEIVEAIRQNQVTILVAETGSGKTTQVPQFLYNADMLQTGRIGITQPRRIAAITVAQFVARQLGSRIGNEVGYQIRFDDETSVGTKIKFMTDGILLQEAIHDQGFYQYGIIGFDEAHERNVDTDFAIGLAKRALRLRPDLKLIIMSATINAEKFSAFFDNAPIIQVVGKQFPVTVHYLQPGEHHKARDQFLGLIDPDKPVPVEALAAYKVSQIIASQRAKRDIMVFMPGLAWINKTIEFLERLNIDAELIPVHGDMSPDEQQRVFIPSNRRRVIIGTNVLETSITPQTAVDVVDSCLIRQMQFDPHSGISSLQTILHSKSGMGQRAGRAGRTDEGNCYRLITEAEYDHADEFTVPEIVRSELSSVVLKMLSLGITDVEEFEFIDSPPKQALHNALETLRALGAVDADNTLTDVGQQLAKLPVEPTIGRMILEAEKHGCIAEICTIAASLSVNRLFTRPRDHEADADMWRQRLSVHDSDFLTVLNVMNEYADAGYDHDWARDHFLNHRSLDEILKIRRQLMDIIMLMGIEVTSVGYQKAVDRWELTDTEKSQVAVIGKAVAAGLMQNLAVSNGRFSYTWAGAKPRSIWSLSREEDTALYISRDSVLFHTPPQIIVCAGIQGVTTPKGKRNFARGCQKVEVEWLLEVAPHMVSVREGNPKPPGFMRVEWTKSRTTTVLGQEVAYEEVLCTRDEVPESERWRYQTEAQRSQLALIDSITGVLWLIRNDLAMWGLAEDDQRAYTFYQDLEALRLKVLDEQWPADAEMRLSAASEFIDTNRPTYEANREVALQAQREAQLARMQAEAQELSRRRQAAAEAEQVRLEQALLQRKQEQFDREFAELLAQEEAEKQAEYDAWLAQFHAEHWPGAGQYQFEGDKVVPIDEISYGMLFEFDATASEVATPERGKTYWGFVNQEGLKSGHKVKKIGLLREVYQKAVQPSAK